MHNRDENISDHFTWGEVFCKCGCAFPKSLEANAVATARAMEIVRAYLGGFPMRVSSWYRCKTYNKQVGGAALSQHLFAKAVDSGVKQLTPKQVQMKAKELQKIGIIGGLGKYPGFTHMDTGSRRTWG